MMKGQIAGLMRQAQQMQENMKKAQDALADILVEGAAGGNLGWTHQVATQSGLDRSSDGKG